MQTTGLLEVYMNRGGAAVRNWLFKESALSVGYDEKGEQICKRKVKRL